MRWRNQRILLSLGSRAHYDTALRGTNVGLSRMAVAGTGTEHRANTPCGFGLEGFRGDYGAR